MKKKMPTNNCPCQVYVDLDELIMSKDCSPKYLEDNLGVPNQVLYDAIVYSTCANWLLKLDYLREFSFDFRKRIFMSITAFSTIHRAYFLFQRDEMEDGWLRNEYEMVNSYSRFDSGMKLHNPMNNLSNRWKEKERMLIDGSLDLHEMVRSSIRELVRSGDREVVDFSYSLFFPEIISPKFFSEAEDCERIVILGMYDSYLSALNSFSNKRFGNTMSSGITIKRELNPLIALCKHILSNSTEYSERIRVLAWKKMLSGFMKKVERMRKSLHNYESPEILPIDGMALNMKVDKSLEYVKDKGYELKDICDWIENSEGVFEPFELDCVTHGLMSEELIWLLVEKNEWSMVDGLIAFQEGNIRDRMLFELSTLLTPISMH